METTQQNNPQKNHRRAVQRRTLSGTVVSDKTEKTVIVQVNRQLRHKLYGKLYTRSRRFHVHDPKKQFHVGDVVSFVECRPISKLKRWRVLYNPTKKVAGAPTA